MEENQTGKKKIGIITQLHKSTNYGGVLQAFALCEVLKSYGFIAEQIDYNFWIKRDKKGIRNLSYYLINELFDKILWSRKKRFEQFKRENIPSSKEVYIQNNVHQCNGQYDAFIVGSDQVWNMDCFDPSFFLDFVSKDKMKISYAASIGKSIINEEYERIYERYLSSFDYLSVREEDAKNILEKILNRSVELTLDPTLLLSRGQWEKYCLKSEIRVKEPYIFCYFLGVDYEARHIAETFAKVYKKRIVTIPHVDGFNRSDLMFKAKKIYNADPRDFIKLIKNAEYIFTDSFHGSVFASIFMKQFFVMPRVKKDMNSRIKTLTDLFGSSEHFCDDANKRTMEYLISVKPIDYRNSEEKLGKQKEASIKYLVDAIGAH